MKEFFYSKKISRFKVQTAVAMTTVHLGWSTWTTPLLVVHVAVLWIRSKDGLVLRPASFRGCGAKIVLKEIEARVSIRGYTVGWLVDLSSALPKNHWPCLDVECS